MKTISILVLVGAFLLASLALPQTAPAGNADNGKKLIEFLLSKEAQETVSSVAIGVPVRKDVTPSDANFAKLQEALKGVTLWQPDWAQVLKDLPADVKRWREATGRWWRRSG